MSDIIIPKWRKEFDIFRKIKSCIILEGNIFDTFVYPGDESDPTRRTGDLSQYLYYYLKSIGYSSIAFYDSIHGFTNRFDEKSEKAEYFQNFKMVSGLDHSMEGSADFTGEENAAPSIIEKALVQSDVSEKKATAVVMDFASRYIVDPTSLQQSDVDAFTILLQSSLKSVDVMGSKQEVLKNLCIIVVNKINDIPAWFYLDNPAVKSIVIQKPTSEEKREMLSGNKLSNFFDRSVWANEYMYYQQNPADLDKIIKRFIGLTDGFTYSELIGLRTLCRSNKISIKSMCSVVDLYKFGITENPWNRESLKKDLVAAKEDFEKRVKGQDVAITQVLDVVKRSATGMSDLTSSTHGKPKGVLFFAGPTGTGKTETAKSLAEKIFGDESACIRFDMSEFRESNSDQRLLGAPPGYVGYESGGQLTNAVKSKPFSILLFDEIEKAHPSILDKFLQILEDGRMTDGKGETVYFSECIIIFTSNLGIYEDEILPNGQTKKKLVVSMDMDYESVRDSVRKGVEVYFKEKLGRPEILNRIGDNIVVYDFIRPDVARDILFAKLNSIVKNIKESRNIELMITDTVKTQLLDAVGSNLDNGGRGIGNVVESMLVNPLSRFMFDNNAIENCRITVNSINTEKMPYSANCIKS